MFKKLKQKFKAFMMSKSGFSLVELIVVIAIMAVMAAVLAPSLLGYVEKSRAQKDMSAMDEITNAIQLSLADQNVYDELLPYAVKGNFSCYTDGDTSTNIETNKIFTKGSEYWLYNDEARQLDEMPYVGAGSMRGVTITLRPDGSGEYVLKSGIVNQMGAAATKKGDLGGVILEDCEYLHNRLRSTVGDAIKATSQTYRNSDYTIFISMGTTGGNQADEQDAIKVYGQFNGTNLAVVVNYTDGAGGSGGSGGSEQPNGGNTPTPTILTMTIDGVEYQYEEGMTWSEWMNSDNCPDDFPTNLHLADAGYLSYPRFINFKSSTDNTYYTGDCFVSLNENIFPIWYHYSYFPVDDQEDLIEPVEHDGYIYICEDGKVNRYLPSEKEW